MGTGIAAMAIGHRMPVVLIETDTHALEGARERVSHQLRHAQLMGAVDDGGRVDELTISPSVMVAARAKAVIEAVTEDAGLKKQVLSTIATAVRPGTPLITNTSGIPIGELACELDRPEDLVGTHFMNPAYLVKTVEVIRGSQTSPATMTKALALLAELNRKPIVVADTPGFVTSRLVHPMINEAARIVDSGTATAAEVDDLMQGCLGHPTGPLRTADLIGIDNLVDALRELALRTSNNSYWPCELLTAMVEKGDLGRKSGRGFYDYGKVLS
jgi:methoxymalonate biosynthesis protein